MSDVPYEQSARSTEDRWTEYLLTCFEAEKAPMTWGEWLAAGQPLPVKDGE